MHDIILLMYRGLILRISNFWQYYKEANLTVWRMRNFMNIFQSTSGIAVIGLIIYFIFFQRKESFYIHWYLNPVCLDRSYCSA